ncbi:hypothetical protein AAFF_G00135170 [Aldrovandia affinis]|uniref:C2H2-type domain-containing protein n=1 Tax=Aldrovandia affinis TaxID=143900 RepID=A0AAD7W8U7_9TELE|nr:hypothetical protein AAFF_G00135170 [Aldrovandia affinis]
MAGAREILLPYPRDPLEAIRCTLLNCTCECFQPGKINLRTCDHCKHGWVAHALDQLSTQHLYHPAQVEIVQSSVVFDISSLMLYGTQALPIRLKILLDRLFSVLKQEEVLHILHGLGWTLRDYVRGYIQQDAVGKVLDRWTIMSQEEEVATLQQFLRFGETKSIVELMALQEQEGQLMTVPPVKADSGIRTFIESSSPALAHQQCSSPNSVHHFENLPNSLPFLLPFQYINPSSAPILGLPTIGLAREPSLPANGLVQEQALSNNSEQAESSSPSQLSDHHAHHHLLKAGPRSLTHSSLSCKTHRMRRMGATSRKGRVCCSSCGKTFYDKGTLKIHYNAVHLKIKHRCTVQGCNMVFSSLRSRNRHSANPNPRLHLPVLRNNRDRDLIRSATRSATPLIISHNQTAVPLITHSATPIISDHAHSAMPITSGHALTPSTHITASPTLGLDPLLHSPLVFPSLKSVQPVQPVPPFCRTLLSPSGLVKPPASLPTTTNSSSLMEQPVLSPSHSPLSPTQDPATDPTPKKKPRKSSMPVKIQKETISTADAYEDEDLHNAINGNCINHNHNSTNINNNSNSKGSCQHTPSQGERSPGPALVWLDSEEYRELHCKEQDQEREFDKEPETSHSIICDREEIMNTEQQEEQEEEQEVEQGHLRHALPFPPQPVISIKEELSDPALDMFCMSQHGLYSESFVSTVGYGHSPQDSDPSSGRHPRTCYVCKKSFKSSYSVKLHYKNVHLKEMHMCTLAGCSAAFPSRRSRDRHSSNINLHRKLLTKELDHVVLDPHHTLLPPIYSGHERVLKALGEGGGVQGRGQGDSEFSLTNGCRRCPPGPVKVLDLSTSSALSSSNAHSSGALDPGSNGGVPLHNTEAVSDGEDISQKAEGLGDTSAGKDWGSGVAEGQPRDLSSVPLDSTPSSYNSYNSSPSPSDSSSAGLPCASRGSNGGILCHICHKAYSNRGTLRVHYSTMHLLHMHHCSMPHCDMQFSSGHSRKRHSQNPNLHNNTPFTAIID